MFSVSNICKNSSYLMLCVRRKSKTHWAKLRRKNTAKDKALAHFDDFYGSVFGDKWVPMREALLRKQKYVALINNFGDAEKTMETLANRGAHCLKTLLKVQNDFNDTYGPKKAEDTKNSDSRVEDYLNRMQTDEISNIYSSTDAKPDTIETADITLKSSGSEETINKLAGPQKNLTLEESIAEAEIDQSRIIDPSMGVTAEALYQYVPATKLKGMEEWVPESLHYSYYSSGKDFPLTIEPETNFIFPEHLKVMTYEMESDYNRFPEPRRCQTGVFDYYPLDCGSIITVLALCLSPGDRVLDMCAAPGGKTLAALQTMLPDVVVSNDVSLSRSNRLHRICRDYLHDFETSNKWRERVVFTRVDGRNYMDDVGFDKVLVDAPCTTDRHSVTEDENSIFRPDRIKERLKLPEKQAELLANALKLVKVGGAVVYSTCSLSPIQNDGVVHMALKSVFESHGIIAVVRDLKAPLSGLNSTLEFGTGNAAPKYGQLVVPNVLANFGPTYFARLVRVK